jgi:amidase
LPELTELSGARIAELVRTRELTRREVVEAHAARIEERNAELNALVDLRLDEALAEADAADAGKRPAGGPLDGVPMSVKENYDVGGMATTMGIPARAQLVAERDELSVERLRAAGALVLGKSNMPDLAIRWNTISSLHGITRNPRDPELSPGGSSGGDAAAVGAGMVASGLGSDQGGSLRIPAAWCGLFGFRPTTGLVAKVPTLPPHDFPPSYDLMASGGTLARSVDDLELSFDVLRGASERDPASVPVGPPPAGPPGRVALMLGEAGTPLEPGVERALRSAASRLAGRGYSVEEGVVPDLRRAPELFAQILGTELVRHRLPALRRQIGASALAHIEELYGQLELGPDVTRYLGALHKRRTLARVVAEWMERYPLVLAPVAGMGAPPLQYDEFLGPERTLELFDRMRGVLWVNLLGLPAAALPDGTQLVGRRFADREVLRAARDAVSS